MKMKTLQEVLTFFYEKWKTKVKGFSRNNKNIEISLNLLKKFSQSWPKHEKPEKWIVKNKNSTTEKINYKFKK